MRAAPARLHKLDDEPGHAYGTVTYAVTVDDRTIGYVGDYRPWRGDRWGGRRWWACHNPSGEPDAAEWDGDGFRTRSAAVAELCSRADGVDAELDDPRVW